MNRRLPLTMLALLLGVVALAGCRGGEPGTALTATFDDVRHLAPRHAVRIADVQVGTVTGIELDGFDARVRLQVDPEHRVPEGTSAAIRQSSLLGENFVELRLPEGVDPRDLPALEDGAELTDTETVVELEDLARRAIDVVGSFSSRDVDVILDTAVEGIGGRGDEIGELLTRTADLSSSYAERSDTVAEVLDGLVDLGADLAAGRDDIAAAIERAEEAAGVGVRQRDRLLTAFERVVDLSESTDRTLLDDNADRLADVLAQLRPVVAVLVDERARLQRIIAGLEGFGRSLPQATPDDLIQIYSQIRSPSGFEQPVVDLLDVLFGLFEEAAP